MNDLGIGSIVAVVWLLVLVIPSLLPARLAAGVQRWSTRFGLTVTDDVRPFLLRRRRATWIGYGVGAAVGVEVDAVVQQLLPGIRSSFLGTTALNQGSLLLAGLGALVGGAVGGSLTPPSGPRVARASRVSLADYVDPVERAAPLVIGATAAAVGAVPLLHGTSAPSAFAAAAAGLGALLAVAVAEGLAALVLTRPQRAATPHQLAWADALRAETVRNLLGAGGALAAVSLIVSVPAALATLSIRTDPGAVLLCVLLGLVALVAASGVRSMLTQPARYFLRRLWPKVAAELDEPARPMEVQP